MYSWSWLFLYVNNDLDSLINDYLKAEWAFSPLFFSNICKEGRPKTITSRVFECGTYLSFPKTMIGPLQLAIHVVQNRHTGEHRDRTNQGFHNLKWWFPFFFLSQCDFCFPVWRFCTLWLVSCKGPIDPTFLWIPLLILSAIKKDRSVPGLVLSIHLKAMVTQQNSAVWSVPWACAQPKHSGRGSHEQRDNPQ